MQSPACLRLGTAHGRAVSPLLFLPASPASGLLQLNRHKNPVLHDNIQLPASLTDLFLPSLSNGSHSCIYRSSSFHPFPIIFSQVPYCTYNLLFLPSSCRNAVPGHNRRTPRLQESSSSHSVLLFKCLIAHLSVQAMLLQEKPALLQ